VLDSCHVCVQIQNTATDAIGAIMLASVLDKFGDVLNSFHDALAATPSLVIEKSLDSTKAEVCYVDGFFLRVLDRAGEHGIVLTETGKRSTGFVGAYLCLCLVGTFRLEGSERWYRAGVTTTGVPRSKFLLGEGPASMEALQQYA
jgi:hypothetical protein